ncbi:MAG: ATP-binding protein [Capsulimonas sp.]|jgi:anti-sigma regulatory factor (Ser/Thr protein kinase)|nr:ATP-binding protein [Capsulimonas sp.]
MGFPLILRLSLELPEDGHYIRTTRLLSRCLLEDMCVMRHVIDDVETIVAELCSNVIRHAQSTSAKFEVTLEYYKPKVVITVRDTGAGFDQNAVRHVGSMRDDGYGGERLGGWGLSLLDGLSDKVDFTTTDPHGTTVRVEKNLIYETQADAEQARERDTSYGGSVTVSAV